MFLIFDTETTGLPKNFKAPISDTENWPRCVQIAWQLHDEWGNLLENNDFIVFPEGYNIPFESEKVHGISTLLAQKQGVEIKTVLEKFNEAIAKTDFIVGQNIEFDLNIVGSEFYRLQMETDLLKKPILDTCTETTATLCQLPGGKGGRFKLPTLTELHKHLFQAPFEEAHNATADVEATTRCFFELVRNEIFTQNELKTTSDYFETFKSKYPSTFQSVGLKHINLKQESEKLKTAEKEAQTQSQSKSSQFTSSEIENASFVHLHNHTQFSVLESTLEVSQLIKATFKENMPAVAITDLGNMMGVFSFVQEILSNNAKIEEENAKILAENPDSTQIKNIVKPIVGSEFYVCENHKNKDNKDDGYLIVLLAKNKAGYQNLLKLSSISHMEGFYYVPRIDKDLLMKYKENLIVLSGNLQGEIPSKILNVGENQAEEALIWWKENFGSDFYLELMRHGLETEDHVNDVLMQFSKKHDVKVIATNNVYYLNEEDADAQDILVCVKEGENVSTPKGRGKGYRKGLENDQYYFKSQKEMKELFADIPESILNLQEIVDKIEIYKLKRDVLLPNFQLPEEFIDSEDLKDNGVRGQGKYLRHLTYEGAKKRWEVLSPEIEERLEFELNTILNSGYQGYFLIVSDLIAEARKMGVFCRSWSWFCCRKCGGILSLDYQHRSNKI